MVCFAEDGMDPRYVGFWSLNWNLTYEFCQTGTGQVDKKNEEQGAVSKDTVRVGRALTAQSQFQ